MDGSPLQNLPAEPTHGDLPTHSSPTPRSVSVSTQTERHGNSACLVIYDVDELVFHSRNERAHRELEQYHFKCLTALYTPTGPRLCASCGCFERGHDTSRPDSDTFHTCDSVSPCPGCPVDYPTVFYCDVYCRRKHRDSHKYVCFNRGRRSRREYQPPVIVASHITAQLRGTRPI